jgi:two-component system NarL family response regulator
MKKSQKIRILVVDDHFVVRMGLSGSINVEADMTVVAEASTGQMAIDSYREQKPDVVLMDLRLPDMGGIEVTKSMVSEFADARVIILSTYDGDEDVYNALRAGARSYLLKTVQREELLSAIRTVYAGERYLTQVVANRLAERLPSTALSERELEVLKDLAKGRSNKEIASSLGIAEITVKLHVSNILAKLNASSRTQAVTMALQRGILHLD